MTFGEGWALICSALLVTAFVFATREISLLGFWLAHQIGASPYFLAATIGAIYGAILIGPLVWENR